MHIIQRCQQHWIKLTGFKRYLLHYQDSTYYQCSNLTYKTNWKSYRIFFYTRRALFRWWQRKIREWECMPGITSAVPTSIWSSQTVRRTYPCCIYAAVYSDKHVKIRASPVSMIQILSSPCARFSLVRKGVIWASIRPIIWNLAYCLFLIFCLTC